jgi:protein TonB
MANRDRLALTAIAPVALGALVLVPPAGGGSPGPPFAPSADDDARAPAASCSPRLQAFFAADFKDQAYQQKAYQQVASSWKRPAGSPKAGGKAVVIVSIARDGKGTPPALHLKSGSDAWDEAAVEAVKTASPFDPLPRSHAGPSVEVHFHFECAA